MPEHAVDQTEAAAATDDEVTEPAVDPADSEMADVVDQRAQELTGDAPASPGDVPASDPIAQAEAHLATVDMDEERRKVAELTKSL